MGFCPKHLQKDGAGALQLLGVGPREAAKRTSCLRSRRFLSVEQRRLYHVPSGCNCLRSVSPRASVMDVFHAFSQELSTYGYPVLFAGVLLENAGVPLPGETAVLIAGFLASPAGG